MIIFTIFLTFYVTRLFYFLPAYKNQKSFIYSNLENFPDCYAVWTWLGIELKKEGNAIGALQAWQEGLRIRPQDFRLNFNIGSLLAGIHYYDDAIKFFEQAKLSALPETKEAELVKMVDEQIEKVKKAKMEYQIKRDNAIIEEARKIKKSMMRMRNGKENSSGNRV